jgi:hypothetical protein
VIFAKNLSRSEDKCREKNLSENSPHIINVVQFGELSDSEARGSITATRHWLKKKEKKNGEKKWKKIRCVPGLAWLQILCKGTALYSSFIIYSKTKS